MWVFVKHFLPFNNNPECKWPKLFIKRDRLAEWAKNKTQWFFASKKHTSPTNTKTEGEMMEKDITCPSHGKEKWACSHSSFRQKSLQ